MFEVDFWVLNIRKMATLFHQDEFGMGYGCMHMLGSDREEWDRHRHESLTWELLAILTKV